MNRKCGCAGDEALRNILHALARQEPHDPLGRADAALRESLGLSGRELGDRWRDGFDPTGGE